MPPYTHTRRTVRAALGFAVLSSALLAGCTKPADAPAADDDSRSTNSTSVEATGADALDSATLATSRDAATALGQGLMKALLARMEVGGPDSALAFCADSAQALTARYQASGVDVHRTSLRVRNPANAPDSAEVRVLEYLAELKSAGSLPDEYMEVRRRGDGTREARYFRPITVVAGCLNCHGSVEQITPSIRTVLDERYPADAAVDYAEGDLRGAIIVRLPLDASRNLQ